MPYGLLVDVRGKRLLDTTSIGSMPLKVSPSSAPFLGCVIDQGQYSSLLSDFFQITTPTFSAKSASHGVQHFIPTKGPPVHSRYRRLQPDKLQIAKTEFANMEKLGIVRRSSSS